MGEPRYWFLVMYDITEAKVLRQVHRKLTAWGKAVQYSVFRVRCTMREIEQLRFELLTVMGKSDQLMTVRLCAGCLRHVTNRGKHFAVLDEEPQPFIMA